MRVGSSGPTAARGIGSLVLLGAMGALFGWLSGLPSGEGIVVVLAGVAVGGVLQRLRSHAMLRSLAPVPAVLGLALVALDSTLGLLPELLAGLSGVALLVWLADDPDRPVGGILRARLTIAVPGLALGIAWAGALLLPSNSASLGVAVALLVFVIVAVAFLIGQPSTFDREEPSGS